LSMHLDLLSDGNMNGFAQENEHINYTSRFSTVSEKLVMPGVLLYTFAGVNFFLYIRNSKFITRLKV